MRIDATIDLPVRHEDQGADAIHGGGNPARAVAAPGRSPTDSISSLGHTFRLPRWHFSSLVAFLDLGVSFSFSAFFS